MKAVDGIFSDLTWLERMTEDSLYSVRTGMTTLSYEVEYRSLRQNVLEAIGCADALCEALPRSFQKNILWLPDRVETHLSVAESIDWSDYLQVTELEHALFQDVDRVRQLWETRLYQQKLKRRAKKEERSHGS